MAKVKPGSAKPGCFSDFFQQLLCAGNANSPPLLHPCGDHITESHVTELVHPINKDANAVVNCNAVKPGVVARLMGLDSLPNSTNLLASKGSTNPDLVPRRRSRSVNFVDYLLKFDDNHQVKKKTSASFREVPAIFQHEKHDLLVVQFGSNLRKQEMGLGEYCSRQRKKQGRKNKEVVIKERSSTVKKERNCEKNKKIFKFKNEAIVVPAVKHGSKVRNHIEAKVLASVSACSRNCGTRKGGTGSRSNFVNQNKQKKKVFYEPKHTKNVREQQPRKKMETECSSENFSPVSVLDYPYLYGPDFLDYTGPLMSKWEISEPILLGESVEDRANKNEGHAYPHTNREKKHLSELMLKLRTLTENDIRELDCMQKRKLCETDESFEELCLAYEHEIFDILLHEVVNELVELQH